MLGRVLVAALIVTGSLSAASGQPIPGLGPLGPVTKLHTGFKFTEGPAVNAAGEVYFSDIPDALIYKIGLDGALSTFRKESGHSNGLMFNAAGELVACEMDGQITAFSADGTARRVLAAEFAGKRFNAPNDLVLDAAGGIYFTDPHFRAPEPLPQDKRAVYYLPAGGAPSRLIDDLAAPNGVLLSPDQKTLYVVPSQSADVMAYPVEAPGKLGPGRVFVSLKQPEGQTNRGGDGLTLDTAGNLYIATGLGLQVVAPDGKHLGLIELPEPPANCVFGGADRKTLYVTARTSVYTIPMQATGHIHPAVKP